MKVLSRERSSEHGVAEGKYDFYFCIRLTQYLDKIKTIFYYLWLLLYFDKIPEVFF